MMPADLNFKVEVTMDKSIAKKLKVLEAKIDNMIIKIPPF
jgi:hypothetical protein